MWLPFGLLVPTKRYLLQFTDGKVHEVRATRITVETGVLTLWRYYDPSAIFPAGTWMRIVEVDCPLNQWKAIEQRPEPPPAPPAPPNERTRSGGFA